MATIQVRRGTAADAASNNPTLADGEIGFETDGFGNFKIGNGTFEYNNLPYSGGGKKLDSTVTVTVYPTHHTLDAVGNLTDLRFGKSLIVQADLASILTVPTNATVPFPIGTVIGVRAWGSLVAASGVTINGTRGDLTTSSDIRITQYLEKVDTDEWIFNNGTAIAISDVTGLQTALDAKLAHTNSATALTDGAAITLTTTKHTLTSDEATVTITDSYAGDDVTIELTLNATSSVWTWPSGTLCVSEGAASGDNTLSLAGTSGDKYIISRKKIGSNRYVVAKNFAQ